MLTHLTLINFALAEHLALDIESGFNVLTGETGAGKSLLLDALSACLGERTDTSLVRFGTDKADVTAVFSYTADSIEARWLQQNELEDESGEIHLRRVIFSTGRSKAWINGRPSSLAELKSIGRLLVQLYSQHSQQQLLDAPYPRQWLDRYSNLTASAQEVKTAYQTWQKTMRLHEEALQAQATRQQQISTLELQIEEVEEIVEQSYIDLDQEYDRLSNHESIMQDCSYSLNVLDEAEENLSQALAGVIKRLEDHIERSPQLTDVYNTLMNAQSEVDEATANLRNFADNQSFDPERMEQLNRELEVFHRLARKYRVQPEELKAEYDTWQQELEHLQALEDPETLAEQVKQTEQLFLVKAQQLEQERQHVAPSLAKTLTSQVKQLALPEAKFEFEFEPLKEPNADGLSFIKLLFTANKGIPPQPLSRVASGGELSRIALVMQVMNSEKTEADVIVFDEIDVGISGGTAEIVGRLLSNLGQHVQVLCITHQAQVAAQSDQHLLVQKQQTNPASSTIFALSEDERIQELARMTGGLEINETTRQHAKQLRQMKFQ
ncbi:DNA repair protein RecN [Acinetobacter sp. HY1485]|uniref:DNA repair protein RecN n=1 Tax=Acinetobacter sp. HY1485 TaxID=2970918 RepID=UPI0022B99E25|nr:DNA repair protein RecN [Acinetobacter sp. HY1485]